MALSTVTLTWDLTDLIESGIAATISLVPTAVLTDSTDHVIIPLVTRTRVFTGGTGSLPGIIACDNSQVTPPGWAYTITVTLANGTVLLSFNAFINFAAGATQDLSTLTPVSSVVTMQAYMPLSGGQFTGAVAPAVAVLADGASIPVNAALGNLFRVTLAGNHQLANPSGGLDGQMIRVEVTPNGHTLTYGTQYNFGDAGAPVLNVNSGKRNTLGFAYNSGVPSWDFLGAGTGF